MTNMIPRLYCKKTDFPLNCGLLWYVQHVLTEFASTHIM